MGLRLSVIFVAGLAVLTLSGACSSNPGTDVVIPTLAVLPDPNSSNQEAITFTPPVEGTLLPDIQSGVDQLFTQTAQAQQQIALRRRLSRPLIRHSLQRHSSNLVRPHFALQHRL